MTKIKLAFLILTVFLCAGAARADNMEEKYNCSYVDTVYMKLQGQHETQALRYQLIARLFFTSMKYLGSDPGFQDAGFALIRAAEDLVVMSDPETGERVLTESQKERVLWALGQTGLSPGGRLIVWPEGFSLTVLDVQDQPFSDYRVKLSAPDGRDVVFQADGAEKITVPMKKEYDGYTLALEDINQEGITLEWTLKAAQKETEIDLSGSYPPTAFRTEDIYTTDGELKINLIPYF